MAKKQFQTKSFSKTSKNTIWLTHLKPLLFQSVVFIQLRFQEAEIPELLHKDVILLLQIFLNLLIFIHECRPKNMRVTVKHSLKNR